MNIPCDIIDSQGIFFIFGGLMKACEKLNIDISTIEPEVIGVTDEAISDWHQKVGIHSSSLRQYAWKFLLESGLYEDLLEDDKYFVRNFGKGEESKVEDGEEFLYIHYPNGIVKLSTLHGKEVLFFRNPEYGNLEKPVDPGPCTSGCDNGSFYSFGTLYPCSHCTEVQRYQLKLKDWQQLNQTEVNYGN